MASIIHRMVGLEHAVYQPPIEPKPRHRKPVCVQVEVEIILRLEPMRHYCSSDEYVNVEDANPILRRQTDRFNLDVLKTYSRAHDLLANMLRRLQIHPAENPNTFNGCINEIIRQALTTAKSPASEGLKILPVVAEITGTLVEHVNYGGHHDEEAALIERTLAESEAEFESSNYGMVPAKESSVKKMLKRVRVDDRATDEKIGDRRTKRKRVKVEENNCVVCLEELKTGSYASRMPCSHVFHGDCIKKWLKFSHYCPVCRFEMPTSEDYQ